MMALRFRCANCTAEIVSRYLKLGEEAKCPTCSANTVVPDNALSVSDEEYAAWLRNKRSAPIAPPPPPIPPTRPIQPPPPPPSPDPNVPPQINPALVGDVNRKSIFDYFDDGWKSLSGRWGLAIGGLLLYGMIQFFGQLIPFVSILFGALATPAFAGGFALFFLNFARNTNPQIEDLFAGFGRYGTLMGIYYITVFCSMIVAIPIFVPMIILFESPEQIERVLELHAVMFIMAVFLLMLGVMLVAAFLAFIYAVAMDSPPVGVFESFRRSFQMVRPHYWKVIGYFIISSLTIIISLLFCLIPALFAIPLVETAFMRLYLDVKADYERTQAQNPPAPPYPYNPPPYQAPPEYPG